MSATKEPTAQEPVAAAEQAGSSGTGRRLRRLVLGAAAVIVVVAAGAGAVWLGRGGDDVITLDRESGGTHSRGSPIATEMAVVELTNSAGRPVSSGELIGRPLVVNFWYSTCPPCRRELPAFAAVHRELGDAVRFVGINPLDTAEEAARFAARAGVEFETLFDRSGDLSAALGVVAFPTTVLIDESGAVVFQHTGELDATTLRAAIDTELLG